MIKMLQYKMYPAASYAVLRQLLFNHWTNFNITWQKFDPLLRFSSSRQDALIKPGRGCGGAGGVRGGGGGVLVL